MLQLLLIDPQLCEKHWLIESWYNYYVYLPMFKTQYLQTCRLYAVATLWS